jgi:hypothetical protein
VVTADPEDATAQEKAISTAKVIFKYVADVVKNRFYTTLTDKLPI